VNPECQVNRVYHSAPEIEPGQRGSLFPCRQLERRTARGVCQAIPRAPDASGRFSTGAGASRCGHETERNCSIAAATRSWSWTLRRVLRPPGTPLADLRNRICRNPDHAGHRWESSESSCTPTWAGNRLRDSHIQLLGVGGERAVFDPELRLAQVGFALAILRMRSLCLVPVVLILPLGPTSLNGLR